MAARKPNRTYQYEPLITPSHWTEDEQRFSQRLTQIVDDLYAKFGAMKSSMDNSAGEEEEPAVDWEDITGKPETFPADVKQFLDRAYPVGSIYMSVNATSPATLFGGTWERIYGRFLLAANSTYAAGSTGGEANHTLTVAEMPPHSHAIPQTPGWPTGTDQNSEWGVTWDDKDNTYPYTKWNTSTSSTGSGAAHNNMPPYLAVYVWKRTA